MRFPAGLPPPILGDAWHLLPDTPTAPSHRAHVNPSLPIPAGGGCAAQCDHFHHAVGLINDKTDGFLDELLPSVTLRVAEAVTGCGEGRASTALAELRATLPQMVAIVGPACSSDVGQLSQPGFRADANFSTPLLSYASTATTLSNETSYTNVARLATNEAHIGAGNALVAQLYAWRRIAVLAEDSEWGRSAASNFIAAHTSREGGRPEDILNRDDPSTLAFDPLDFDPSVDGETQLQAARRLLERLDARRARIVYLVATPATQERIFAASARYGLLRGAGYAWMLAWVSEDALRGRDGRPSAQAIEGSEGAIGLRESSDDSSVEYQDYHARWRAHSEEEGCARQHNRSGR